MIIDNPSKVLRPGEQYTATQIHDMFGGASSRGIVKPSGKDYVFVFSTRKSHGDR